MKPNKYNHWKVGALILFCLPLAVATVVCVVLFVAALTLAFWPLIALSAFFALRRYNREYARGPVNTEDPGFVPHPFDYGVIQHGETGRTARWLKKQPLPKGYAWAPDNTEARPHPVEKCPCVICENVRGAVAPAGV